MVSYGNASGPVPPGSPLILAQKGSLFLTRSTRMTYAARRQDLLETAADLFAVLCSGAVKVRIEATSPLREAAAARAALEARRTTGSTASLP